MSLFRHSFRPLSSFMAAITGESSSASLNSLFITLSLILSSFLFMLSQNTYAHPSSSESMMPYDDDTLLANAHYIMKCPASQDETTKRLRLHSVIFFYLSRISRCCTIQGSLCGCHTGCHNKVTGCIGCCMNLVNNSVNTCYKTNNFKSSSYK